MAKSTISMVIFHFAMFVYQRVGPLKRCIIEELHLPVVIWVRASILAMSMLTTPGSQIANKKKTIHEIYRHACSVCFRTLQKVSYQPSHRLQKSLNNHPTIPGSRDPVPYDQIDQWNCVSHDLQIRHVSNSTRIQGPIHGTKCPLSATCIAST